jgi:hypothetical protein
MYYIYQLYGNPQVHLHLHYSYKNNFSVHRLAKSYTQMA